VRSWDGLNKQVLVGTAQTASSTASLDQTPGAERAVRLRQARLGGAARDDQDSADKRADRIAQQIGTTFAERVRVARGNPGNTGRVGPSASRSSGDPFVGNFTLSHARHVFDQRGYRTSFVASGRQRGRCWVSSAAPRGAPAAAAIAGVVTAW